jgi:hypothetical protein
VTDDDGHTAEAQSALLVQGWTDRRGVLEIGANAVESSMIIADGFPAIAYHDPDTGVLNFVRALDAQGNEWGVPLTIDDEATTGTMPSAALINGNPAVAYYQPSGTNLRFVRAHDAAGTSWNDPLSLDSSGVTGLHPTLREVNGRAAIVFNTVAGGLLRYKRATNDSASTWGAAVTVDSSAAGFEDTSMCIVYGRPAVCYYRPDTNSLLYCRAADEDGSVWGTPAFVENGGAHCSMAFVRDRPCIAFDDPMDGGLYWASANAGSGEAGFGSRELLRANASEPFLLVINGCPALSFSDELEDRLMYMRSNDNFGTNWPAPIALDKFGSPGEYSTLLLVDGRPAISYGDDANDFLSFVRYGP